MILMNKVRTESAKNKMLVIATVRMERADETFRFVDGKTILTTEDVIFIFNDKLEVNTIHPGLLLELKGKSPTFAPSYLEMKAKSQNVQATVESHEGELESGLDSFTQIQTPNTIVKLQWTFLPETDEGKVSGITLKRYDPINGVRPDHALKHEFLLKAPTPEETESKRLQLLEELQTMVYACGAVAKYFAEIEKRHMPYEGDKTQVLEEVNTVSLASEHAIIKMKFGDYDNALSETAKGIEAVELLSKAVDGDLRRFTNKTSIGLALSETRRNKQ